MKGLYTALAALLVVGCTSNMVEVEPAKGPDDTRTVQQRITKIHPAVLADVMAADKATEFYRAQAAKWKYRETVVSKLDFKNMDSTSETAWAMTVDRWSTPEIVDSIMMPQVQRAMQPKLSYNEASVRKWEVGGRVLQSVVYVGLPLLYTAIHGGFGVQDTGDTYGDITVNNSSSHNTDGVAFGEGGGSFGGGKTGNAIVNIGSPGGNFNFAEGQSSLQAMDHPNDSYTLQGPFGESCCDGDQQSGWNGQTNPVRNDVQNKLF